MKIELIKDQIILFLRKHIYNSGLNCFVVGISGGVDSALVSTLCALSGIKTYGVVLDCFNTNESINLAKKHCSDLVQLYSNFSWKYYNIEHTFNNFPFPVNNLAAANLKSRLRMCVLYAIANEHFGLVVGTGNKVEDFGVGFFTKYGDGGVDISPIGDLYKSEVRELAEYLGCNLEIVNAIPNDGLWEDGRSDEDQLGISYNKLESVMKYIDLKQTDEGILLEDVNKPSNSELCLYMALHNKNKHKMEMPQICRIEKS